DHHEPAQLIEVLLERLAAVRAVEEQLEIDGLRLAANELEDRGRKARDLHLGVVGAAIDRVLGGIEENVDGPLEVLRDRHVRDAGFHERHSYSPSAVNASPAPGISAGPMRKSPSWAISSDSIAISFPLPRSGGPSSFSGNPFDMNQTATGVVSSSGILSPVPPDTRPPPRSLRMMIACLRRGARLP